MLAPSRRQKTGTALKCMDTMLGQITVPVITRWLNSRQVPRLCIKVEQGQGDRDIGTRVWELGTWGGEMRDLRTSSMGRVDVWDGDVWDGDAGTSNTGTQGTRDVNDYCKSRR